MTMKSRDIPVEIAHGWGGGYGGGFRGGPPVAMCLAAYSSPVLGFAAQPLSMSTQRIIVTPIAIFIDG